MAGRRKHSAEFKIEAVKLVTEQGVSFREAAEQLEIHEGVLRNWKKKLDEQGEDAFPGNGKLSAEQAEIRKLREELRQVRMERDILKKATAFFAKESK